MQRRNNLWDLGDLYQVLLRDEIISLVKQHIMLSYELLKILLIQSRFINKYFNLETFLAKMDMDGHIAYYYNTKIIGELE